MEDNLNPQVNYNEMSDFERKIGKFFISTVRLLIPLVFVVYGLYAYFLNTKYSGMGHFLLVFIGPLLLLPMLGSMLIWCLFQVKNGISGKPMLMGNLNRQPFIFLGMLVFLSLSIACVGLFVGIFYLFSM